MEKNLPFVSLPFIDKGYNKLIIPFLGKLDDGNVFKEIITILLSVLSVILLLGGVYLSFKGLSGENGYIKNYISSEFLTGGKKFGATLGLIIGFAFSVFTSWILYSVLKKRTEQMKSIEYNGLLSFVFVMIFPKLILVIGELLFVMVLYSGVLQLVAALVGSFVYAPLSEFPALILGLLPGMGIFSEIAPQHIYGDYNNFKTFIQLGLFTIAGAFLLLIAFYIYKEVYNYSLKLVSNLISFLPKFAIPLALRKRVEN